MHQAPAPDQSTEPRGPGGVQGFIDAHVHVWTDDFTRYPLSQFFAPRDMSQPTASPDDFFNHARPSGIDRAVLIQMSYYGFDNSYMLDTLRRYGDVFAGVAMVNWEQDDPESEMRELARQGIRGFRIDAERDPEARCLGSEGLDKMFRFGGEEQLTICLLIAPEALPVVARQCGRFPHTPVLIDHLGQVGMHGEIPRDQTEALCALSKYREVRIKVSGFYALASKRPPHRELVPLIHRVYEAFGPQRLMWGSDYPFQLVESYEDSVSVVRDHLDFLSAHDRAWLLGKSAESVFF